MQVQHKKGQNPYFKLKDIAKTFGITKALSGVTLDIYAGGGIVEPAGVVIAAIAMNLINSLLTAMKVNSNYQTAIIGLILIAVLAFKFVIHRKEAAKNE